VGEAHLSLVEVDDMEKPSTQILLKVLRTNLKLAIDNGVSSGPDPNASFFSNTGDVRWVWKIVRSVMLFLRSISSEVQPVATVEAAVRSFATKESGKADLIAFLEYYVANAAADLLMLTAWNAASGSVGRDSIPVRVWTSDHHKIYADSDMSDLLFRSCDHVFLHFVQHCRGVRPSAIYKLC